MSEDMTAQQRAELLPLSKAVSRARLALTTEYFSRPRHERYPPSAEITRLEDELDAARMNLAIARKRILRLGKPTEER